MNIKICDSTLSVEISKKGAEIQSIMYKDNQYLWQADPDFWAKKAPILFPIVGKPKYESIEIMQQQYEMPKHGFAKDMEFEVLKKEQNYVCFLLKSSEETKRIYPYDFKFTVEYWVENGQFLQKYIIENTGSSDMIYGFGLHPAFNLYTEKSDITDFYVSFRENIDIEKYIVTNTGEVLQDRREKVKTNGNKMELKHDMFYEDAIIIDNFQSPQVSLYGAADKKILTYEFFGFKYLALWQARNSKFLCIEPWTSMAGISSAGKRLEENSTMKKLATKSKDIYSIKITF